MGSMFCFQCQQTARNQGCTAGGVCGKRSDTANLQDELAGKIIALAKAAGNKADGETKKTIIDSLFVTITNVNFDNNSIQSYIYAAEAEKAKYVPMPDYELGDLWQGDEDVRSLKSLILFGLKGMAAYAHHARALGYQSDEVDSFFVKALAAIYDELASDALLQMVLEVGRVNLVCMELLDTANTQTYGKPAPTKVTTNIDKGPFIVVTGHDLHDLHLLLQQTQGKGINIYTHGEMLPCHAYPKLRAFEHFKGNFGTAWQNQQREFDNIPAPILFTTNCIMPVKDSYSDKVFTTSVVGYPDMVHIDNKKDFSPVISKALALGGYKEDKKMTGINGGDLLTTGFGHDAVLAAADKIVAAVKAGAVKHFFLVGGCDGAVTWRNYYTEFVRQTPADTLILTLACGKYRFNDLDLGTIGDFPRIMDMGQCNDAYSAIKVAVALAEAFGTTVNKLPLSLVLSWYEQKAVCILLTLLHLGIENMLLGPTLPAFISPNVLKTLVDKYKIRPISTPEEDLQRILAK